MYTQNNYILRYTNKYIAKKETEIPNTENNFHNFDTDILKMILFVAKFVLYKIVFLYYLKTERRINYKKSYILSILSNSTPFAKG